MPTSFYLDRVNMGTFVKQTFGVEKDPIKQFYEKSFLRGKLQNLGFLGFSEKT